MKLSTALNNALKIAERIKSVNGLIGTPGTNFECFRVKRAWVFGSAIKGKSHPNDLDIIIDGQECGVRFASTKIHSFTTRKGARLDKAISRTERMYWPLRCKKVAYQYMRRGMKNLSIHAWDVDCEVANPRIMIYPRNDLPALLKNLLKSS